MWKRALVCVLLLSAEPAAAQPGYSAPVSRQEVEEIIEAQTATRAPGSLEQRIERLERLAQLLDHLAQEHHDPEPALIDRSALARFRSHMGRPISDADPIAVETYARCHRLVQTRHGLSAAARRCLARRPHALPQLVALVAPAGYLRARNADASADYFRRIATRHRRAPTPASRRAVATMMLASGDFEGVVRMLGPLSRDFEAQVTVAVAELRDGNRDAGATRLARLVLREPSRPEAAYDLATAFSTDFGQHEGDWHAAHRAAFVFGRAALCTLDAATLPMPSDAWERIGHVAEDGQRWGYGQSHWGYRTGTPAPRPFLPYRLLPPSLRDPAGGPASGDCTVAAAGAADLARAIVQAGGPRAASTLPPPGP